MLTVFSLKNPGRGFVLTVFALKNPVLTVFALKNPGEGFCYLARSQKPWWGFYAPPVLSKKNYSGSVDLEEHLLARRATADCGGRRPKGYF